MSLSTVEENRTNPLNKLFVLLSLYLNNIFSFEFIAKFSGQNSSNKRRLVFTKYQARGCTLSHRTIFFANGQGF